MKNPLNKSVSRLSHLQKAEQYKIVGENLLKYSEFKDFEFDANQLLADTKKYSDFITAYDRTESKDDRANLDNWDTHMITQYGNLIVRLNIFIGEREDLAKKTGAELRKEKTTQRKGDIPAEMPVWKKCTADRANSIEGEVLSDKNRVILMLRVSFTDKENVVVYTDYFFSDAAFELTNLPTGLIEISIRSIYQGKNNASAWVAPRKIYVM